MYYLHKLKVVHRQPLPTFQGLVDAHLPDVVALALPLKAPIRRLVRNSPPQRQIGALNLLLHLSFDINLHHLAQKFCV